MRIGCILGTGCNAAYMENCGSIKKIAHLNLISGGLAGRK
jgi:hexokinase